MEKSHATIDKTKFNRWLNIRKTTLKELNLKLKKQTKLSDYIRQL